MMAIFLPYKNKKLYYIFFLILLLNGLFSSVSRFNNADPMPLYGTSALQNFLTLDTRRSLKNFFMIEEVDEFITNESISFSFSPFYQISIDGTDYKGNNTLTYFDNSNNAFSGSGQDTTASTTNLSPVSNKSIEIPMPISSLKGPWNMFGLFYSFDSIDQNQQLSSYDSLLFPPIDNRSSKVLARSLGFGHVNFIKNNDNLTKVADPLNYGYFNYRNNYFNIISNPASRDPNKLFGYGYFNVNYEKYGIRGQCDIKLTSSLGIKVSSGVAHLSQNNITLIDTTTNYYGPNCVHMLSITDQVVDAGTNSFPSSSKTFDIPNIYQLTPFSLSNLDGGRYIDDYSNFSINSESKESQLNTNFADQFKSQYLLNVQHNLNGIKNVLGINFDSYEKTEVEDPTFELYFRKLFLYNSEDQEKKSQIYWPIYGIMPILSLNFSCPTSSKIQSNKLFSKEIGNNGHWSYGGNAGIVIDFFKSVSIMVNCGFSFFSEGVHFKLPVPTSIHQEGIFPYTADAKILPGNNFTFGLGFLSDKSIPKVSFGGEYLLISHNEDTYNFIKINNPFKVLHVNNLFQRFYTSAFSAILNKDGKLDTFSGDKNEDIIVFSEISGDTSKVFIPDSSLSTSNPVNYSLDSLPTEAVNPNIEILYWGDGMDTLQPDDLSKNPYGPRRFNQNNQFSLDDKIPFPDILNIKKDYLIERSSWLVHMLNFNLAYDISENVNIGISLQQPFSLRNAYNSTTFACSLTMLF